MNCFQLGIELKSSAVFSWLVIWSLYNTRVPGVLLHLRPFQGWILTLNFLDMIFRNVSGPVEASSVHLFLVITNWSSESRSVLFVLLLTPCLEARVGWLAELSLLTKFKSWIPSSLYRVVLCAASIRLSSNFVTHVTDLLLCLYF